MICVGLSLSLSLSLSVTVAPRPSLVPIARPQPKPSCSLVPTFQLPPPLLSSRPTKDPLCLTVTLFDFGLKAMPAEKRSCVRHRGEHISNTLATRYKAQLR